MSVVKEQLNDKSKKKVKPGDVFSLERDYSKGMAIRFSTTLPQDLSGKIGDDEFSQAIEGINNYFTEAEECNFYTFLEGCCGLLFCFIPFLFYSRYQKVLAFFSSSYSSFDSSYRS
eukprot:TRINITY_DN2260_c0_g1_i1.p1 TRINITY_DN2260_c0_g1~~TRINITY_DN2260_c0_g1_i1.p1  ORF type:complete len:116 (-),score=20.86 TRINITY_DN2260_c0_g1_i1:96-443(-)